MKSKLVRMLLTISALFAFSGITVINTLAEGPGQVPLPQPGQSSMAPEN